MKDNLFFNQPAIRKLIYFIQSGGPEEHEYEEMTKLWDSLVVNTALAGPDRYKLVDLFGEDFLNQTIQGHSYRKPHGYAGDYQIIDFIYQQKIIAEERFQKWDKYFHSQHAAGAVRNRKDYFIRLIKDRYAELNWPIKILNLASGPCRDVYELFQEVPVDKIRIHCVDLDANAIQYAKKLLGTFSDHIRFTQQNIFKFDTNEKFDLIWSAGLFDYFSDEDFVKVLSKAYSWCSEGGEIVIGNFSNTNPTRAYMEIATEWILYHRSEQELRSLAHRVVSIRDKVEVRSESLGVNLFVHIKRGK